MNAYYNENDPYCADWLRNLIARQLIAPGDVDARDIREVQAVDLRGYSQCHFFAGIGGWSCALRLAGVMDDVPAWTGSCPCQPFSAAGQRRGAADERHLWPAWFRLIAECHPATILGEQVASAIKHGWLDTVFADLEGQGYACGAAVLPACSVGAPHIRQRLWFVAHADEGRSRGHARAIPGAQGEAGRGVRGVADGAQSGGAAGIVAHADGGNASAEGLQRGGQQRQQPQDGGAGELGDARGPRLSERERDGRVQRQAVGAPERQAAIGRSDLGGLGNANGARETASGGLSGGSQPQRFRSAWSEADWIECRDGKARPVEPGTFPLAHGIPGRVGRLRAYGNAIVPQVAAEFIKAIGAST